jgi:hypothetical protein
MPLKNIYRLCLENKLIKYILILSYIPFTSSISAWSFPCYFHTKTQCTILVHSIRATWQPGLIFLLLIARKNPICRCVNRQSATESLGLCVLAYIGLTCVMDPSFSILSPLSNTQLDISKESTPQVGQIFEADIPTCCRTNLPSADACCRQ